MNPPGEAIEASYRFCRRIGRQARSNLCVGFLLLPRDKRRAMHALYAFMRHTDDLADNTQPVQQRDATLRRWRAAFEFALQGRCGPTSLESADLVADRTAQALLPAMVDAIGRFKIPPEHLHAVIDGVEMDLTQRRYETFEELQEYCQRVASAVGLACVHVWGFRGQQALEPARKCGIALQLTNIVRDLRADAQTDRVYLPLADLRRCDYSVDDLVSSVADERFDRLMKLQFDRAERFYREGAELMHWLEPDGRRVFGMMMATYRALLERIKRRPHDVFTRHVRLTRRKKLQIAARWILLPPRAAALL